MSGLGVGHMSIRSQFFLVLVTVFVVSLGLTLFWFNRQVNENIEGKLVSEARGICALLKVSQHECQSSQMTPVASHLRQSIEQISLNLGQSNVSIRYISATPLNSQNYGSASEREIISQFNHHLDLDESSKKIVASDGSELLRYAQVVHFGEDCRTCHDGVRSDHFVDAVMMVDMPINRDSAEKKTKIINLALIAGSGYLIAFLGLAALLNLTILRRLDRLTTAAQALTQGDYLKPFPVYSEDSHNQIDQLTATFLTMQRAIEKRELDLEKKHRQAYSMFHDHKSVMLLINPEDHTIVDVNQAAEQFYGFTKREMVQKSISEINLLPVDQVSAEMRDCMLGMKNYMQFSHRLSCGEIREVEVRSCPVEVDDAICLFMIVHDITEQKRAEIKVIKEHKFFQTVIDGIVDPIFVLGLNYKIKVANIAAKKLIGKVGEPLVDQCCYETLMEKHLLCGEENDSCPLKIVLSTGRATTTIRHFDKSNKSYEISASPYVDDEGNVIGVIECFRDITQRLNVEKVLVENERKIHDLIHYDPLTHLPNRTALNDRLSQAIYWAKHQNRNVGLLCLDLDRFKKINDTLGHQAGDQVLQVISRRLQDSLRTGDTVSRVGGDDFFIVLESIDDEKNIDLVVGNILSALNKSIDLDGHKINITASVGVAIFPNHSDSPSDLMKFADIAMYSAKKQGGDIAVHYLDTMDERASEFLVMEAELKQAIAAEELYLQYQPQFDLKDNSLVGMEALVRWKHPIKGIVPPGDFIFLAEETGLIQPLGEWVLREACRQISQWIAEGLNVVPVAVNVSSLQMQKEGFIVVLDDALSTSKVPAEYLELEITESTIMSRLDASVATLQAIRQRGMMVAIDDFGTGYSSLSYLKRFPLSKLKIDRSFVSDLPADENDASIVTAIISMSQGLGLKVIAEGVETDEQKQFLIDRGCDQVQGFLYSRPLDAEEIKETYLLA
jgi:diguanylate cyclase (GGDEF)-like protein/PAS domain S-box-containing protein